MKALPFLSLLPRLPGPRFPAALLGATVLELVVLTGHLVAYPFGLTQERRTQPDPPPETTPGAAPGTPGTHPNRLPGSLAAERPVVLLHGFIDNRSVFVLLRTAAELLGRHVEEVCARTGEREVDIVGHSLGGLIARYYVQRLGGDRRVRTLVTLGTPHGGTAVAPGAGIHPIVRQMRGGSALIEELRRPAPGCRTRFVSFWSELDQVMVPVQTACVDHPDLDAVNVRVTGIGHLALPVHPAVAAAVREALETQETREGTVLSTGTSSVA
ncbi:lipase family alpha/beta hydrolase [Streptomyces microflavus]|uniref:lipase family alpha/beta hydrolase n=1 Tax=Streptomyces microflavus TaxID=1919 RepID=UPI0038278E28